MRSGQPRPAWRSSRALALALALTTGCADDGRRLERALLADRDPAAHCPDRAARYVVHCPDEVALRTADQPEEDATHSVGADGRIPLPGGDRLRADGLTAGEIAERAAKHLGLPLEQVQVEVVGYNSQQIYLFGEVTGLQRAVAYGGPETVVDLLQRAGGVGPSAAVGDVQVLRSHVADGSSPELFRVDLDAILFKNDQRTNVRLEPFDQVYIGQTRKSSLTTCFPPWLQPLYQKICGMRPRWAGAVASAQEGLKAPPGNRAPPPRRTR